MLALQGQTGHQQYNKLSVDGSLLDIQCFRTLMTQLQNALIQPVVSIHENGHEMCFFSDNFKNTCLVSFQSICIQVPAQLLKSTLPKLFP